MESEMLHFPPVVLKKNPQLPHALPPHYSPPKGINSPLLLICNHPDGRSNIIQCTTGTDIQSGIVPSVLASGACQVRGGTGNINYGYSNPMGYQTSDFRLLWTIPPNPQHPSPP